MIVSTQRYRAHLRLSRRNLPRLQSWNHLYPHQRIAVRALGE